MWLLYKLRVDYGVLCCKDKVDKLDRNLPFFRGIYSQNRDYYRKEIKLSVGMNFGTVEPEREFKVFISCKCSQIICSTSIQCFLAK